MRSHLAARQQIYCIRHRGDLVHVVGYQDAGEAQHVVQAADQPQDDAERNGIQAYEGFVVDEDLGIHDDGTGERDTPPHAAGELGGHELRRPAKPHRLQLGQHQLADQPPRKIRVLPQRERHVLEDVQVGEQRPVLEQHPHAPAQRVQRGAAHRAHVLSRDDQAPRVRAQLPGDKTEERGLAGSARSHDRGDPAGHDVHVESVEDRPPVDCVAQIADLDD